MSHFNFNLNDLTSDNMVQSYIGNSSNYTPDGKAMGLTTSMSSDPSPQKALTTFSVSDIMQGAATYKPEGLVYNSFNNSLSKDLSKVRNTKIGNSNIQMSKAQIGLMGYDTKGGIGYNLEVMGANASAALTGTTSGTVASPGNPVINTNITGPKFQQPGVQLTESEMADLVIEAGLSGETAAIAIAIAYKESRFNSGSHALDSDDDSWGLFQFNFIKGANTVESLGATPQQCTIPSIAMIKFIEKSSNATQFRPWAIMPNGNHGKFENNVLVDTGKPMAFLPQARDLLRAKGKY
jgi:hypothetical protein